MEKLRVKKESPKVFPSKKLGQNFLFDKKVVWKVIETANLSPQDLVLEVGPGTGNLTKELSKKAKKVIAVEKDKKLAEFLKEFGLNNVEIISDDVLKIKIESLGLKASKYKIIANLPFYLTGIFLRKFLENSPPKEMVLILQKEVAQRMCSKPPKMNLLAASVQFYAKPKIISFVSRKSFWPQPKVDSAVIKISEIDNKKPLKDSFFKVVRTGFSSPRKQLINNLSKGLRVDRKKIKVWLGKNGISFTQRAETLNIESWLKLAKNLKYIND